MKLSGSPHVHLTEGCPKEDRHIACISIGIPRVRPNFVDLGNPSSLGTCILLVRV